jgi:circadian clock protein KaiC
MTRTDYSEQKNVLTGVPGLDYVLAGGLSKGRVFLVEGDPGTGKTTIALSFVVEGAKRGERCLYVTLSETEQELRMGAASHGWTLGDTTEVFELAPPDQPARRRSGTEPPLCGRPGARGDDEADL